MTLPSSGPLSLQQINTEFARGLNLNSYRGTVWWTDANANGVFSSGAISVNEFYGKRPNSPVTPGNQDFATPGNYNFTVPLYSSLIIQVWGGGGGGGAAGGSAGGQAGGASGILGLQANGGGGGANPSQPGGGGGGATGGDVNLPGNAGSAGSQVGGNGSGGSSPNGGGGGGLGTNGGFPGGGGGGQVSAFFGFGSGGGGAGYVQKTYASGDLTVGATIPLTVGSLGLGAVLGSGSGANGRIYISWS